jgi:hypothetical protein
MRCFTVRDPHHSYQGDQTEEVEMGWHAARTEENKIMVGIPKGKRPNCKWEGAGWLKKKAEVLPKL